ncbi:MAG: epoxyqueuosine reductase [Phycisphaerales bacterium]|nr:MAG: epoxyqueuosine reductase [Phycisphaerales bacterium]
MTRDDMSPTLDSQIKEFALAEGADLFGVAPVERYAEYGMQVQERMEETGATSEDFMIAREDTSFFARLVTAENTLPEAKAIIVIGAYAYDELAAHTYQGPELRGKIARTYSYYPVVRQIAEAVTKFLRNRGYAAVHGQDVPLKYVADRIGLGCYGKHGVLLTERYGSYVALRAVISNAPLAVTQSEKVQLCRDCELCTRTCPTGALYAPYKVNPRLCLNPITRRIDHIAPEIRPKMGNRIHGCDICQEVCPANRGLTPRKPDPRSGFDPQHHASHKELGGIERSPELLRLLSSEYPQIIRRNAVIALANTGWGRKDVLPAIRANMETCGDDLRSYFQWAVDTLSDH